MSNWNQNLSWNFWHKRRHETNPSRIKALIRTLEFGLIWEKMKIDVYMGVSKNRGTPKSCHFNRVFHYKPSILGYPNFWKHPYIYIHITVCEHKIQLLLLHYAFQPGALSTTLESFSAFYQSNRVPLFWAWWTLIPITSNVWYIYLHEKAWFLWDYWEVHMPWP